MEFVDLEIETFTTKKFPFKNGARLFLASIS